MIRAAFCGAGRGGRPGPAAAGRAGRWAGSAAAARPAARAGSARAGPGRHLRSGPLAVMITSSPTTRFAYFTWCPARATRRSVKSPRGCAGAQRAIRGYPGAGSGPGEDGSRQTSVGPLMRAWPPAMMGFMVTKAIIESGGEDTERSRVCDIARGAPWPSRYPARTLRNPFLDRWREREDELAADPAARHAYQEAVATGTCRNRCGPARRSTSSPRCPRGLISSARWLSKPSRRWSRPLVSDRSSAIRDRAGPRARSGRRAPAGLLFRGPGAVVAGSGRAGLTQIREYRQSRWRR
jgi:hypothetical protein